MPIKFSVPHPDSFLYFVSSNLYQLDQKRLNEFAKARCNKMLTVIRCSNRVKPITPENHFSNVDVY